MIRKSWLQDVFGSIKGNPMGSTLTGAFAGALLVVWSFGSAGKVEGQIFRPGPSFQAGKFINAPRSISQQLRDAEAALEEKRYSDAVVRLGDLLAFEPDEESAGELIGQDFFLDAYEVRTKGRPAVRSMLRMAREMIGQLPADATETYELRYGAQARKDLEEASQRRDWQALRDVRRKYFHTLAGYEASFLLAQRELLEGRGLGASLFLDDLVATPRAVGHLGNGVLMMHAAACQMSGRLFPDSVKNLNGKISIDGELVALPDADKMEDWFAERFQIDDRKPTGRASDYALFGATPDRNSASGGQLPLSNERWMLDTTSSPLQERAVRKMSEELVTSGKLPPPNWIPLRVGETLLMRTTERLVGVDYRTGKRVWTYPWQSGHEMFENDEPGIDNLPGESEAVDLLTQRVWNDVPYGQISSDGERVYLLDDLNEIELASLNSMLNIRGIRPADTSRNTLVALELNSEGKILWHVGAGSGNASALSDAFFLGPPLPLEGRLYVLAEISGDINLCCLDPRTGSELWRQQLVAVESGSIEADPIRRVAGAMPTYHEGILICPTGAGTVVALDLADRMLRWGVEFPRNSVMASSLGSRGKGSGGSQLMNRWFSGVAIAADGALVVTPIESDRLMGLDLLTGESLFSPKNRVHMRYLAGIRDGRFYVAGGNQLRSFDLKTGAAVWSTPRDLLAPGQQIAGYGVFGDGTYYLPSTGNEILVISLDDGTVVDRRKTAFPLGNLVAARGEIISASPTSLAVAFGEATLEPLVDRRLDEDPDDFDALVRKSQLLIQRGDRLGALKLLDRARDMQPDNDEVRMLSVSAMLGSLRDSPSIDPELVETLDGLIDRPSQRVELLALQVRASFQLKKYLDAASKLVELSRLVTTESLLDRSASSLLGDDSRQCTLDSWIAARAAEIAKDSNKEDLDVIDGMIGEEADRRLQSSTGALRKMLRHFGKLAGAEPIRIELAGRLYQEQSYLELERLALDGLIPNDDVIKGMSTDRLWMLADSYAAGSMPKDVLRVLDELQTRADIARPQRAELYRAASIAKTEAFAWPREVSLNWDVRSSRNSRGNGSERRITETDILAGRQFEGWRLMSETNSPLGMRDPAGMLRRIPLESAMKVSDNEAQISGGAMVVVTPDGLICVNLHNVLNDTGDAVQWQRSMSGDGEPVANRRSRITPFEDQVLRYYLDSSTPTSVIPEFRLGPIMGDRVLLLQGGDLMAIDLMTSETLWRNSSAPVSGAVLSDGEKVAVVSPATSEVVFFDLLDGRKLGADPWEGGEIWNAMGCNVLSYQDTETLHEHDLRLTNPFTGEVLLSRRAMGANRARQRDDVECAYARVLGRKYFVLLDNDGNLLIWNIVSGEEVASTRLTPHRNLIGLNAMMLDDAIVLLPKMRMLQNRAPDHPRLQVSNGKLHVASHAVHVVSLSTGELMWEKEFEQPWGCTLTQPSATPLLLFSRSPYSYTTTTSRRKTLDVLAIDVRDGNVVDESIGHSIPASRNDLDTRITVQPTLSRIIVQLGSQLLTYNFGRTEVGPESAISRDDDVQ